MSENTPEKAAKEGTVQAPTIVDRFREYLANRAEDTSQDTNLADDVAERQVAAILNAQSEDDVWEADTGGALEGRDIVGTEVTVNSIRVAPSTRDDIVNRVIGEVYIQCEAIAVAVPDEIERSTGLMPGAEFILSTGAPMVVAKLRWFEANDKLPVTGVIQGITTGRGNTVLKFARPPRRAVQGQTAK